MIDRSRLPAVAPIFALTLALLGAPAHAQTAPDDGSATTQQNPIPGASGEGSPVAAPSPGEPGWAANLFQPSQTTFLGDMWGLRTLLGRYGVSLGLLETSEVSGNPTGGIRRGVAYKGLLTMSLGVDTEKAFGWQGGTFNLSALQIRGRDLSNDNLGVLQVNSGAEAPRSTRLWEAWFQQSLLGGKMDIKLGQQSIDQEFMVSTYGGLFINGSFAYPLLPSIDQYAGGPIYPLASLGARVRVRPAEAWEVLLGVFDDNPPGGPFLDNSSLRGASQSGTRFNTGTGALVLGEAQYTLNKPSTGPDGKPVDRGMPGYYRAGGWYDTGRFPDQRFDSTGLSLADPASTGVPRMRRGNWGVYVQADQMIWRPSVDAPQAVGAFFRVVGAPGDRNQLGLSFDVGLTLKAPLPGRDDDSVGIGYGYGRIGPRAIRLDRDRAALAAYPVRSGESFMELTYQAQMAPWWAVQPSFQYFWLPAGGVPNPVNPTRRIGNAAAFTLRTNITF